MTFEDEFQAAEQLASFLKMISIGHSASGAASKLSPKMLPEEVLEYINRPGQEIWLRSYKIAKNEALFDVEAKYLTANPSTRNFQAELAARNSNEWTFRAPSPSSRERASKDTPKLPNMRFNPPPQLFPNAPVPNSGIATDIDC